MNLALPLAAFGEIVGLLFLIISFIVWVVNQANSQKIKQLNQKQKQPPRPPMPGGQVQGQFPQGQLQQGQPPRGQMAGGRGPGGQGPLGQPQRPQNPEVAIEEFLRRAAQQQQGQRAPARSLAQRPSLPPAALAPTAEEEQVYGKDVASYEQTRGVEAHVRQTMAQPRVGTSDLTDLDEVDEQLKARLQATFDHQVGTLTSTPASSPVAPAPRVSANTASRRNVGAAAAGIAAMLSDRRNLASAIVLQDILKRPEI